MARAPQYRDSWRLSAIAAPIVFFASGALAADAPAGGKRANPSQQATPQEALAFYRKLDWPRAVKAYENLLEVNPYNGLYWYNYAYALHSLKRYDDAIKAAERSVKLGHQPMTGLYNIACAYALLGKTDEALTWLQKALDAGFRSDDTLRTDSDLDSLRSDPRFKDLTHVPPGGLSREERWYYDLDFLLGRMEKVHYRLYGKVSREQLQTAVNQLKSRAADLKDEEMTVGIQRILAMVGDGHTAIQFDSKKQPGLLRYPIQLYWFKEGLYVRGAAPEYASIVGGKVLRIGGVNVEQALAAVEPLCSRDNAMGVKAASPFFLTLPAALSYLKLTDDTNRVPLTVQNTNGGQISVELHPAPFGSNASQGFVLANHASKAPKPLSFEKGGDKFWFEYLPARKLVYFQYNAVGDKPTESLEKFCARLIRLIDEKPVEYLVIDMRNNGGGNNFLNRPLVHGLIRCDKINRAGHLFVMVGRRTFSAAMNGAVDIERNTRALFVGEPTGSSPNFVGETSILTLPCSGLRLSCSSLYWQSSTAMDRRVWIPPELVAEPSVVAFSENRDPGWEAIIEYIDAAATSKQ
jgi:tetratricopeptide (TPR) repeat protein